MRRLLFTLVLLLAHPAFAEEETPPQFLLAWGGTGGRKGEFNRPIDVAVDSTGRVYVADNGNRRVQVFDSSGRFLAVWDVAGSPFHIGVEGSRVLVATRKADGLLIQERSLYGTLLGEKSASSDFPFWRDVALSPSGHRYRIDHSQILMIDSTGALLGSWGVYGSEPGELHSPEGIAVDGEGNVYVADTFNHRVQKFTADGILLAIWGHRSGKPPEPGAFNSPSGIAVDKDGNVYVADFVNNRIQKFGPPR